MAETERQYGERNYSSLYNILQAYRRAGTRSDTFTGEFNRFDTPATFYFRIFFDFSKGLLNAVDQMSTKPPTHVEMFEQNRKTYSGSALNYLVMNDEWERADMLRDFINLLSNINTHSPWYFSEVTGLSELMDRTEFNDTFAIPEPKAITIKCLPDAYDTRIGTLLDLYRSICYSWQRHKEIVPANLRRFDMYIYIFNTPIRGIHEMHELGEGSWNIESDGSKANILSYDKSKNGPPSVGAPSKTPKFHFGESKEPVEGKYASFDHDKAQLDIRTGAIRTPDTYITSSKLIHLMDCEFDLNASKSGYGDLKNDDGFSQIYEIPIKVNTCVEQRYNEFLLKFMGDYVAGDFDLKSDEQVIGDPLPVIKNPDEASKQRQNKYPDNRLDEDRLKLGVVSAEKGVPQKEQVDVVRKGTTNRLKQNIAESDSLLDPWITMGKKKLGDLTGQAKQIIQAGKSALESWTDISRLNKALADNVDKTVSQLVWGNIFEINLQDITRNAVTAVSELSSDNIFESVASGWMHSSTDRSEDPTSSLGRNLADGQPAPNPPNVPQGNLFDGQS